MLGAKTGPRMTFLANCHQDQTFNRYHRGKPTPLGPAPDPFKVHAACPAQIEWENFGQIFAEITELGHGHEPADGDPPLETDRVVPEQI